MDLAKRYSRLADAILFQIETAEAATKLGQLDSLLHPWVRDEIESRRLSLGGCDSARDLEAAVSGLVQIGHEYATLLRELFVDLLNYAPEPPWRVVDSRYQPQFAVRAQPTFLADRPTYALRRTGPAADGVENWEFSVIEGAARPVAHRVALRLPGPLPTAEVPPALWAGKENCLQLYYGFRAVGRSVHLHGPSGG
jgi:hypothetical protein